jgi:AmpE protein
MTLLAVLIALLLDRLLWNPDPYRQHQWFERYWALWRNSGAARWLAGTRGGVLLVVAPPTLLVLWLDASFAGNWTGLLQLAFASAILLFALGPQDLGRHSDAFLAARDQHDEAETATLATELCGREQAPGEPLRTLGVARCLLAQANRRLFAPIFWFLVLGPAGAVLYRLVDLARTLDPDVARLEEPARAGVQRLQHLLDWVPARLTALAYGVTGNFEAVSAAWQHPDNLVAAEDEQAPVIDEAEMLLAASGTAALDSYPTAAEAETLNDAPPVVEDAMALIWRSLTLWVICIAAATVFSWFG